MAQQKPHYCLVGICDFFEAADINEHPKMIRNPNKNYNHLGKIVSNLIKVIWGWFPLLTMISSEVAVKSL